MDDSKKNKAELIEELQSLRSQLGASGKSRSCCERLLDGLPIIIFELNLDGYLTYVSDYGLRAFGYTKQDLDDGFHMERVFVPEDFARIQKTIPLILKGEGPVGEEYLARRQDGSTLPVRVFSHSLTKNGVPVGIRGMVLDVSDVRNTELALSRSESYFKALFNNTATAMVTYNQDGIIEMCNARFERLAGRSADEIIGTMRWSDFVAEEDLPRMLRYHEERNKDDPTAPTEYVFTFVPHNRNPKRVRIYLEFMPDTKARICSLVDITASEEAKEALRRSEERYQLVVNGANDGIWDWNVDTGQVYYSPRYKAMLGYEGDEFPNELDSWTKVIHPDDKEYALSANQACIDGKVDQFEITYRMRHKDGSYRWILGRGAGSTDKDGRVHRLAGTHTDITSRKKTEQALRASEERYELVVRGANDGIWDWNMDTGEVYYSPRFKAMLGYEDHEYPNTPRSWLKGIHPDDKARARDINTECAEGRVDQFELEYRLRHKNGSYRWILVRGASVKDQDGKVHRMAGTHTDITERKQTEQALRASEERYELVVRGANDGIWDWNNDTDEVYYSPRYKAMLGYENHEFPNEAASWMDAIHPDDKERVIATNMECVNGKTDQFELEYRLRHKNGSYRWILGRGASVKGSDGKVHRMAGTHTDITKRKETEQALRTSEERFREIIENASDGIYQCTLQGQFLTANQAFARQLGYDSPDEMTQDLRFGSKQMWVNPKEREIFLEKLCKHGKLEKYEQNIRKKDGTEIWISENVRTVQDDEGEILYYEGFVQDITERKQHERTSKTLYAISRAVNTTRDLQHLYENIHAILGEALDATNFFISLINEEEECLDFPYFKDERDHVYEFTNIQDPEARGLSIHIIRTGEPIFLSQTSPSAKELQSKYGIIGTPPAAWIGVPLRLDDRIIGTMTVQSYTNPHQYTEADIKLMKAVSEQVALAIERKANEEALTRLNEELEYKVATRTAELSAKARELEAANRRLTELDEIKSSLVSSVSHELRTPLTSIRGFAKLAGKNFLRHFHPLADSEQLICKGERIRHNLSIIEDEGERLTRLINDFLDINRIESGKTTWNDAFINPCDVLHNAAKALVGVFSAKPDVELVIELPETTPLIHADPDKIQQIIINLLSNAAKFTTQGEVRLTVVPRESNLLITVSDTGPGIPEEDQAYIFEKFYKSHTGDTVPRTNKGTGLGLAISKEIVEHYGGTIWVESTQGEGCSFLFTLPTLQGSETPCK